MNSSFGKKIMIVSNSISGGGAEISMMRLFESLRLLNLNVKVCALNQDLVSDVSSIDVAIMGRNWGSGIFGTVRNLFKFRSHLRTENPDILLVNCELPELYVSLFAPNKLDIFVVEHTSRPWRGRRILGLFVRTILLARRAKWITVSRDEFPIWPFSMKPIFVPNTHIQAESFDKAGSADLVYVGRLNKGKHPEIIALAAQQTQSTAEFFGDGPEMKTLREKFNSEKIKFHGFVNQPWSKISPSSIVVVASEFEGDGMIIVEAVANRNPILLAENSDLRRFNFPDANYFKSLVELCEKIDDAKKFGSKQFCVSNSMRSRILEEREPARVASQWLSIFNGGSQL